jgi:hypothetical protein
VVDFLSKGEVLVCEFSDSVAVLAGLACGRFVCTSLWVEADDSYAFSYPVSWNYNSGGGCAWFGYFFDDFVALHLDFEWFLGDCFFFRHTGHCNNIASLFISFFNMFMSIILQLLYNPNFQKWRS